MTSFSPSTPLAVPEQNSCDAEHRPAERGDTARRVALAAGLYAVAAGIITLVGWATDMPRLTDWKNDGISMFPNAAACAAMCGVALLASDLRRRGARLLVRLLAGFVIVVAGLTLFEHVT